MPGAEGRSITVGCGDIVGTTGSGRVGGYRVVLGVVSAPRRFLPGITRVPEFAPFPFWRKAGMVIRSSTETVTVSVPKALRSRLRISWGNPARMATAVRFTPCPSARPTWNGYAGGFFLRGGPACVPLIFTVGGKQASLRFGVDRQC